MCAADCQDILLNGTRAKLDSRIRLRTSLPRNELKGRLRCNNFTSILEREEDAMFFSRDKYTSFGLINVPVVPKFPMNL